MKKLSPEYIKNYIESRNGTLLSISIGNRVKIRCKYNHEWEASFGAIKNQGSWCPGCYGNKKLTIEVAQKIARERGGQCLSLIYNGTNDPLLWQCASGHQWSTTLSSIKSGSWCRLCSTGLYESICRIYFETIFGEKFIKFRPFWLRNSGGYKMELDGYCEKLGFAFEHNGHQHFKYIARFHKNKNDLDKQKADDQRKIELCKEHKIKLLIIPQLVTDVALCDLKNHIKNACISQNIQIPQNFDKIKIDLLHAYDGYQNHERMREIQDTAKLKGGKCLSDKYLGCDFKLKFICSEGHIWETTPTIILGGCWCPRCSGVEKYTIERLQELAHKRGGYCLSKKYVDTHSKLRWKCSVGHEWETASAHIICGKWCPVCGTRRSSAAKRKYTIDDMNNMVSAKGGKCLSDEYINGYVRLKWQCKCGHIWEAMPCNIKLGKWCPECSKLRVPYNKKYNVEFFKKYAENKGGTCLSDSYRHDVKLKFRCQYGHEWEASHKSIIYQNTWCRKCFDSKGGRPNRKKIKQEPLMSEMYPQ